MDFKLEDCVEQVLVATNAEPGDRYSDDFGNHWVVHDDRDGLRLEIEGHPDAWIPYFTAMKIRLPGLQRLPDY
jgi:hypothetical protein